MVGIFDRLVDQGNDDDKGNKGNATGLSPLDVADLPDDQRQIMLSFFRHAKNSGGVLTLEALEQRHTEIENIAQILGKLAEDNWLIRLGEPPNERYKVNLRHRRASKSKSDMWASITDRLADDNSAENGTANNHKPKPSLPSLSDW